MSLEYVCNDDWIILESEPITFGNGLIAGTGNNPNQGATFAERMRVVAVGPGRVMNDGQRVSMPFAIGDYVLVPLLIQVSPNSPPRMPIEWVPLGGRPESDGHPRAACRARDVVCKIVGEIKAVPPKPIVERVMDGRVVAAADGVIQDKKGKAPQLSH